MAAFEWDINAVSTDAAGNIVVATQSLGTWTAPDGTTQEIPHAVVISPESIADRMNAYSLATSKDAFEAVMREHGCRVAGLAFDSSDTSTVSLVYATGTDTQRDNQLAAAAVAIEAASPKPKSVQERVAQTLEALQITDGSQPVTANQLAAVINALTK